MMYNCGIVEKVQLHINRKKVETMPEESKISKAQQKAVHKYVKNNYDRLEITVPKGQKAVIKSHADSRGESVNGFISRAVTETMQRDKSESA